MKFLPKKLLTSSEVNLAEMTRRIVEKITSVRAANIKVAGFITMEQEGEKGKSELAIHTLDGQAIVIGVQGKARGKRVGKYAIDTVLMEETLLQAIGFKSGVDLYVIHEIGPIETMSRTFSETAKMLLKNERVAVLATVAKQGHGFVREAKRLPGLDMIEVTGQNAAQIEDQVIKDFLIVFAARSREQVPPQA